MSDNHSQTDENATRILKIDSLNNNKNKALELFSNVERKVQIYSKYLDPRILNNRDIELNLAKFARKSRFSRIEILIQDEKSIASIDHRLINLAQKFTSAVEIKVIAKDYIDNPVAFYLIDNNKMLYRSNFERFEAEYHQKPTNQLKQMSRYFLEVWERSDPASSLRAFYL